MATAIERVAAALAAAGVPGEIQQFPQGTRTAEDAARAIGTTVGQIVKSLVFLADDRPILVLVSGAHRVDPVRLAQAAGAHAVRRADAATVRDTTGFAIGGVPPVGHERPLPVIIDRALLRHPVVYAAAGTPQAIFAIPPARLQEITDAAVADLAGE